MQLIFIFLGNILILVGFYFLIKKNKKPDLNTNVSKKNNAGIQIIEGVYYKKDAEKELEIEAEKELELIEGDDYQFELSDEYDDEVYDDESIIEISKIIQKSDIKTIIDKPADNEVISSAENLIFGADFTKKSFEDVELILEKNVNDFIIGIAEKRKDIREFVLLHNGENYLEEYNKLNNNNNNSKV